MEGVEGWKEREEDAFSGAQVNRMENLYFSSVKQENVTEGVVNVACSVFGVREQGEGRGDEGRGGRGRRERSNLNYPYHPKIYPPF